jgi:putative SOS response-associated peptidase YedK
MCRRATLARLSFADLATELGADFDADDAKRYRPRYNLASTDLTWLLVADGKHRRIVPAVWGLPSKKRPIINVRAEAIERGAFRHHRHGAMILDGFYQWAPGRRPYWYRRAAGGLLLVASVDAPLAAASPRSAAACAVVTVEASADVLPVHDRMPAILDGEQLAAWLAGGAAGALAPAAEGTIEARAVSRRVNRVAHDDAACIAPAPEPRDRQLPLLEDRD